MDRAKLIKELRGWTFTILAVLAFRTFLYEAVYIPSGSMIPTLQIGDYVIVEKWAYGARLPFTDDGAGDLVHPEARRHRGAAGAAREPARRRPHQARRRGRAATRSRSATATSW